MTPATERSAGLIVGSSRAVVGMRERIARVAVTDCTVLLTGESGTGKELNARAIHENSPRRRGPFIAINCGELVSTLAVSQLFGHEQGAFTGAAKTHRGVFEQADGGTVFLDEIGDLPPEHQVKLLRVLQEKQIVRIGSEHIGKATDVDVRVIAATNKDLRAEVETGGFREDLYARLAVVQVVSPPLRERPEDIPVLARHFLAQRAPAKKLLPRADALLAEYPWPRNVRQLENFIERSCIFANGHDLDEGFLRRMLDEERVTLGAQLEEGERPAAGDAAEVLGIRKASPGDRRCRILETLERSGPARPCELCRRLDASPATLRRDLRSLEEDGCIRRLGRGPATFCVLTSAKSA